MGKTDGIVGEYSQPHIKLKIYFQIAFILTRRTVGLRGIVTISALLVHGIKLSTYRTEGADYSDVSKGRDKWGLKAQLHR